MTPVQYLSERYEYIRWMRDRDEISAGQADQWRAKALETAMAMENNRYPDVTRVEVIDQNGRSYVNKSPNNKVSTQIQDEGRTLKIFIDTI